MACDPRYQERLHDLARGALSGPEADRVLEHALSCPDCSRELEFLADLTTAVARLEASPAASRPASRAPRVLRVLTGGPRRRAVLAAAAAVLVAAVLAPIALRDGHSLRDMADIRPLPFVEGTLRSGDVGREPRFQAAMKSYSDGDHATAARGLEVLLREDPGDHKLRIYLAVSQLQLGRAAEAIEALRPAVEAAPGLVGERALWYTAMAHLLREEGEPARRALEALRARGGRYRANAEDLLEKMGGAGP